MKIEAPRRCQFKGCDRFHYAKGFCDAHYRSERRKRQDRLPQTTRPVVLSLEGKQDASPATWRGSAGTHDTLADYIRASVAKYAPECAT